MCGSLSRYNGHRRQQSPSARERSSQLAEACIRTVTCKRGHLVPVRSPPCGPIFNPMGRRRDQTARNPPPPASNPPPYRRPDHDPRKTQAKQTGIEPNPHKVRTRRDALYQSHASMPLPVETLAE